MRKYRYLIATTFITAVLSSGCMQVVIRPKPTITIAKQQFAEQVPRVSSDSVTNILFRFKQMFAPMKLDAFVMNGRDADTIVAAFSRMDSSDVLATHWALFVPLVDGNFSIVDDPRIALPFWPADGFLQSLTGNGYQWSRKSDYMWYNNPHWSPIFIAEDSLEQRSFHRLLQHPTDVETLHKLRNPVHTVSLDERARSNWSATVLRGKVVKATHPNGDFGADHTTDYIVDGEAPTGPIKEVQDKNWPGTDWDMYVEPDNDLSYLLAFGKNVVGVEIEQFALPWPKRPLEGDYLQAVGRFIVDCGHNHAYMEEGNDDYLLARHTEIHPPEVILTSEETSDLAVTGNFYVTGAFLNSPVQVTLNLPPRPSKDHTLMYRVTVPPDYYRSSQVETNAQSTYVNYVGNVQLRVIPYPSTVPVQLLLNIELSGSAMPPFSSNEGTVHMRRDRQFDANLEAWWQFEKTYTVLLHDKDDRPVSNRPVVLIDGHEKRNLVTADNGAITFANVRTDRKVRIEVNDTTSSDQAWDVKLEGGDDTITLRPSIPDTLDIVNNVFETGVLDMVVDQITRDSIIISRSETYDMKSLEYRIVYLAKPIDDYNRPRTFELHMIAMPDIPSDTRVILPPGQDQDAIKRAVYKMEANHLKKVKAEYRELSVETPRTLYLQLFDSQGAETTIPLFYDTWILWNSFIGE